MKLVERPAIYPMRCMVYPQFGNTRTDIRWIDTEREAWSDVRDQRLYLSEPAVREAAKLLGFTDPGEVARLRDQRDQAKQQLAIALAEVDELTEKLDAVKVLTAAGYTPKESE